MRNMEKELSYEEKEKKELRDYIDRNTYHIIESALQNEKEVDMIIKVNEENNYMYDICCNNLINSEYLSKLLRFGYVALAYSDNFDLVLRHKSKINE